MIELLEDKYSPEFDLKQPLFQSSLVGFLANWVGWCVDVIANQLCSFAVKSFC